MAFPNVVDLDTKTFGHTDDTTSHSVTVATNVGADDWCYIIVSFDGAPVVSGWPVGFEERFNSGDGELLVLRRQGAVSDFTLTTDVAETMHGISIRITGAHPTTAPEASVGTSAGNNSAPDSASLTPSWGADDTLWLTICGYENGVRTVSAYPANYTGGINSVGGSSSAGCGVALARRQLNAATEDPGAFTLSGNAAWDAVTIAIPPAPAGGGGGATATPGVIAATASLPAAATSAGVSKTPTTIAATSALPSATATGGTSATTTPGVLAAIAALPAATASGEAGGGDSTATPASIGAIAALPSATPRAGTTVTPTTLAAVCALPQASVSAGTSVTPATIALLAQLLTASLSAGATAAPSFIPIVATLPAASALAIVPNVPGNVVAVITAASVTSVVTQSSVTSAHTSSTVTSETTN